MLATGWKDGVARCIRVDLTQFTGKVKGSKRKELVIHTKDDVKTFQAGKFRIRVKFHNNGKWLLSANRDLWLWDVESGKLRKTMKGHRRTVAGMAVTPDGKYVVSAGEDITYRVHRLDTGCLIHTEQGAHLKQLSSLALSPNGKTLATGGDDNVIKLWQGW
jgi:WD40 repeat protein